jgi:hypothetical protein
MAPYRNHASEQPMLRFTMAIFVAMAVSAPTMGADRSLPRHVWHRTSVILPPGLPRPHYNFRTTISYDAPYSYHRRYYAYEEAVFTPAYVGVPYVTPWVGAPVLPGYYGSAYSYEYQGPYYGGPYVSYWDRLPYSCGVYGYC